MEDGAMSSSTKVMSHSKTKWYKWEEIDWHKLGRRIFKLQKRIYQASRNNNLILMRNLQKLLLRSKRAKLLAVKKVAQDNNGKNAAGIDGVKKLSSSQKMTLAHSLKLSEKCKPIRRVWIPKPGKSEKRPLGIPVMADRAKQALVKMALEPQWEAHFEPNSYGFRPSRSCWDAEQAIYSGLNKKDGAYVLDADISGCFDNIDHHQLLQKLNTFPKLRRVIKGWLKAGVMEGDSYYRPKAGTPQGGVISPLLANIALHGMEYEIKEAFEQELFEYLKQRNKGYSSRATARKSLSVIRYADDFVIMHESKKIIVRVKQFVLQWLLKMGLQLKESKTKIVHTLKKSSDNEAGFDFLSFNIRQYPTMSRKSGKVLLIKPSRKSQKMHRLSIAQMIKRKIAVTQEELIDSLNPIIKGWSNYFRTSCANRIFSQIDDYMFHRLWSWACKRHPNKGVHWIKSKYFRRCNENSWRFATASGKILVLHSDIRIKRHIKIKGLHSPYDGDTEYWSRRNTTRSMRCI